MTLVAWWTSCFPEALSHSEWDPDSKKEGFLCVIDCPHRQALSRSKSICLAVQPGDVACCCQHQTKQPEVGLRQARALRVITDIWSGFPRARITHFYNVVCTFLTMILLEPICLQSNIQKIPELSPECLCYKFS